jgi:hypothetical protein
MTQFTVPVTWRVTKCDPADAQGEGLKIKVSADVTSKTVNDPDQFYVVDPRSLGGVFRNTEFSMEWYESRGTKAISSSADDQTGAVLVNAATGLAKLAAVGLGKPAGPAAPPVCSAAVTQALAAIGDDNAPGQSATVDRAQEAVAATTLSVARITARAAALGTNLDNGTRGELGRATALLDAQNALLKLEKAKLDKLLGDVTATTPLTFSGTNSQWVSGPTPLPAKALKDWNVDATTAQGLNVYLQLTMIESLPKLQRAQVASPSGRSAKKGLPYREPLLGRLEVCSPTACGQANTKVVKKLETPVLQLGRMFYLPFEARTFASIKNGATFSEGGSLLTATYNQPRAAGVGASQAFKDVAEQGAAFVVAQRGAETARLNAKTAQAKAQKDYNEAVAALAPAPADTNAERDAKQKAIAAFEIDTTLAEAETASIEAGIARDAARALLAQ